VIHFIKKNASILDEMSVNLSRLSASMLAHTQDDNALGVVKPGTFLDSWKGILQKTHELGAHNLEQSKTFNACVSSLMDLHRHTERSRKNCKDGVFKSKKVIEEAEAVLKKTRQRLDYIKDDIMKSNNAAANGNTYRTSVFKSGKDTNKVNYRCGGIFKFILLPDNR
jgi:hypothetical protein